MTPNELHNYLLSLKNKNALDPNIAEYKKTIREELRAYRSNQPTLLSTQLEYSGIDSGTQPLLSTQLIPNPKDGKDIVFYSFMEAEGKPKIGEHEYKRLKLSWSSLRKYNKDIEIRFCYKGGYQNCRNSNQDYQKQRDKWQSLCDEYNVKMYPFHTSFFGKGQTPSEAPNAWCIHRWYNLALWKDEELNILYLDADTYINGDVQLLFDIYKRDPVYGREELGFRHDPNLGVCGEDPRFYLDLIDASILAAGGIYNVQPLMREELAMSMW
jgi:hypothetical protein